MGKHSKKAPKHKKGVTPKSAIELARARNRRRYGPDAGEMHYRPKEK